ncbi:MAG: hypothetical protein J0H94_03735 [Rhizobiales bacterium]|nr:hypothetical protein [Hyphomicrobiales bacterium]
MLADPAACPLPDGPEGAFGTDLLDQADGVELRDVPAVPARQHYDEAQFDDLTERDTVSIRRAVSELRRHANR